MIIYMHVFICTCGGSIKYNAGGLEPKRLGRVKIQEPPAILSTRPSGRT